ncbi:hypothetical protein [Methyloversatilis sp.]|uniref:hypothetical protein n=1 Tax=Methyloversatilis sp. TaxID=2569862 RepID=UPI0035B3D6FD
MSLPIQTFWLMNSNVNRLMAEKDLRAISVNAAVNSKDGFMEFRKMLTEEMGSMFETKGNDPMNAKRDEVGFAELKAMAAM